MLKVGNAPIIIGEFDIEPSEMTFTQYMPVRMPWSDIRIPESLKCYKPLVDATSRDIDDDDYVYLTAKHLFVTSGNMGNRPGWHLDGFGTNDINYIWYDEDPTIFCVQRMLVSRDHHQSMQDMANEVQLDNVRYYPRKTLLRLDNTVVHAVNVCEFGHMRTFVKVSISRDRYDLKGNAHNHLFDYNWEMKEREATRNHTTRSPAKRPDWKVWDTAGQTWLADARL